MASIWQACGMILGIVGGIVELFTEHPDRSLMCLLLGLAFAILWRLDHPKGWDR